MAPLRGSDEGCTCKPKASPWAELGQPFGPKPARADLQHFFFTEWASMCCTRCRTIASCGFYNLRKTKWKDFCGSIRKTQNGSKVNSPVWNAGRDDDRIYEPYMGSSKINWTHFGVRWFGETIHYGFTNPWLFIFNHFVVGSVFY